MHLAIIVGRAEAQAAPDVALPIPERASSLFGTEHFAVLIGCTLSFSAHDSPVLVLDAIRSADMPEGS